MSCLSLHLFLYRINFAILNMHIVLGFKFLLWGFVVSHSFQQISPTVFSSYEIVLLVVSPKLGSHLTLCIMGYFRQDALEAQDGHLRTVMNQQQKAADKKWLWFKNVKYNCRHKFQKTRDNSTNFPQYTQKKQRGGIKTTLLFCEGVYTSEYNCKFKFDFQLGIQSTIPTLPSYHIIANGNMLNWLLLISLSLVSFSSLASMSAHLAILPESQLYFSATRSQILLLFNCFILAHLVLTPILFNNLCKYIQQAVYCSLLMVATGVAGRYLCSTRYSLALGMSAVVAVGQALLGNVSMGLVGLFPDSQKKYVSLVTLVVPSFGVIFSIGYGMMYIASEFPEIVDPSVYDAIDDLNRNIGVMAVLSCVAAGTSFTMQSGRIAHTVTMGNGSENLGGSLFELSKHQLKEPRIYYMKAVGWGTIVGLNCTYGSMFGVYLHGSGLPYRNIAFIGLCGNLSAVLFGNMGGVILRVSRLSSSVLIFVLNVVGIAFTLYLQASVTVDWFIMQSQLALGITVILFRAALSSFGYLSIAELSIHGSSIFTTTMFIYIASAVNFLGNCLVDWMPSEYSLTVIPAMMLLGIFGVYVAERGEKIGEIDGGEGRRYKPLPPEEIDTETTGECEYGKNRAAH